mgnify:CR=1 FL=1|jgi:hypothetical protein
MKIQKTISLTTDTAKIAATIEPNFSQWVRIGLRAHRNKMSLASEIRARIHWAQCAHYLASYIGDLDTNDLDAQQVMELADAHAKKQMTLEEFE